MHYQAGISFDCPGVIRIVVNAVAVKRQRGVAKKERAVEAMNLAISFIGASARRLAALGVQLAIDEFLPLGQCQPMPLSKIMAQRDKSQRPAFAALACHILNDSFPFRLNASQKWSVKNQSPRSPHPARKSQIGNKTSDLWMPVAP